MKRDLTMRRFVILLVVAMGVSGLGLPKSSLAQGKLRIAVTAFENKVKMPWWDASWRIGEGLAEMLTTELMRTGRFIVVERQGLGDVVREQELGQSGLMRRETAAPTGQLLGAQVVVRGAITEFEARSSGAGAGVRSRDVAFEGKYQSAHVALDLRLIDASSGQVMASHHAAKAVPAAGGALGARVGSVTFGGDAFFQTPIGQATRAAMQDAVQFVLATLAATSPTGGCVVGDCESGRGDGLYQCRSKCECAGRRRLYGLLVRRRSCRPVHRPEVGPPREDDRLHPDYRSAGAICRWHDPQ